MTGTKWVIQLHLCYKFHNLKVVSCVISKGTRTSECKYFWLENDHHHVTLLYIFDCVAIQNEFYKRQLPYYDCIGIGKAVSRAENEKDNKNKMEEIYKFE